MTPTERRQNATHIRYRNLIEQLQAKLGDAGMWACQDHTGTVRPFYDTCTDHEERGFERRRA